MMAWFIPGVCERPRSVGERYEIGKKCQWRDRCGRRRDCRFESSWVHADADSSQALSFRHRLHPIGVRRWYHICFDRRWWGVGMGYIQSRPSAASMNLRSLKISWQSLRTVTAYWASQKISRSNQPQSSYQISVMWSKLFVARIMPWLLGRMVKYLSGDPASRISSAIVFSSASATTLWSHLVCV